MKDKQIGKEVFEMSNLNDENMNRDLENEEETPAEQNKGMQPSEPQSCEQPYAHNYEQPDPQHYGQQPNGQSYGQQPYGQNYGQPNYGPSGYGQPNYGQAPYEPYGYSQSSYAGNTPAGEPQKKTAKRTGLKITALILVCAIVFGSLGYSGARFFQSRFGRNNNYQTEQSYLPEESDATSGSENSGSQSAQAEASQTTHTHDASNPLTLSMASGDEAEMSIPDVVDKTAASVVEITTEYVTTSQYMQQYITSGAGSGVIITEDGYILTNNHVIKDATSITVTLRSGESYPAELVGLDEDLDIALVKIDASSLTPATIGSSSDLRVGESIIAIGNPLGQLGGSVTDGIISALDRSISIEGTTMSLMQLSISINPGNSGGGLFDMSGSLVGIVNAKSSGDNIEGIGFAIPIDDVLPILDQLRQYGYITGRPAIGVTMIDISSPQMAWMYRVDEIGTYVYSVTENSPAYQGGLRAGDLIVSIDGTSIESASQAKEMIQSKSVGDEMTFVVKRGSQQVTLTITVGEYVPSGIQHNASEESVGLVM